MHITYQNPGYSYSIESILLFQTDDQTSFWSEPLLHFYPQIDRGELVNQTFSHKRSYLKDIFSGIYEDLSGVLAQKAARYNDHFAGFKPQINEALSDAFDLDAAGLFNDLTANITLNPISPRFLLEQRFDIFYQNSERGALGLSLHEVIHYFWFHVWNRHFGDSYAEYETPSLKWILSEMVVEPIMSDPRLSRINPYFPRENGGCVYPYFQTLTIDGKAILDHLTDLYRQNPITDFMEQSYALCTKHESAIRRHIQQAEQSFQG